MKLSRILPLVLFVGFSALTAEVVIRDGFTEWLRLSLTQPSTGLLLVDLTIALSLFTTWMVRDARARGVTVWPYVIVTIALGSVGPLAYLVVRSFAQPRSAARTTPASAPHDGLASNATSL